MAGSALSKIPVILLSGESAADLRWEALRLGAYTVIQKPFDTPDLVDVMFRALHRKGSDPEQAIAAAQIRRDHEAKAGEFKC